MFRKVAIGVAATATALLGVNVPIASADPPSTCAESAASLQGKLAELTTALAPAEPPVPPEEPPAPPEEPPAPPEEPPAPPEEPPAPPEEPPAPPEEPPAPEPLARSAEDLGLIVELIGAAKTIVTTMQADGCLPDVPPGEGTELTPCHSFTAQLLSHIYGAVAEVTAQAEPDLVAVGERVAAAGEAIDGLIAEACIPDDTPPQEPPLPLIH